MRRLIPSGFTEPDAGTAGAMLAFVILTIFGGQLAYRTYFHLAAGSWEKVPATVTGIVNSPKSATLNYSYIIKGQRYTGDRYEYFSSGTVPEKSEINDRFQSGDRLLIRVDPRKPSRSVVQRNPIRLEQITGYILIIGFSLAAVTVFFIRRKTLMDRVSKSSQQC